MVPAKTTFLSIYLNTLFYLLRFLIIVIDGRYSVFITVCCLQTALEETSEYLFQYYGVKYFLKFTYNFVIEVALIILSEFTVITWNDVLGRLRQWLVSTHPSNRYVAFISSVQVSSLFWTISQFKEDLNTVTISSLRWIKNFRSLEQG